MKFRFPSTLFLLFSSSVLSYFTSPLVMGYGANRDRTLDRETVMREGDMGVVEAGLGGMEIAEQKSSQDFC